MMRSRRARSFSSASAGWVVVLRRSMSHLPSCPLAVAAAAAASMAAASSPSSWAMSSTTMARSARSLRMWSAKRVVSSASSALSAIMRSLWAPSSRAPARTNRVWYFSRSRASTGSRPSWSFRPYKSLIRAKSPSFRLMASRCAASFGARSALMACRLSVVALPVRL